MDNGHRARPGEWANSQTPMKNTSFLGICDLGELEHRAIPPTSSTDEWLISAIIFLWTEAGTPGKQVKPDVTGRKRRLYGLNNITNTCKNRGYLRYFMGRL